MTCLMICENCRRDDDGRSLPHCAHCAKALCSQCLPISNHDCSY